MSGHSQFKNIMFRKGKQDKARSKLFSKLAREIIVASKSGLPDPNDNARLRTAVLAARAENMPKDNIERAIKKGQGADAGNYDEVRYEGYAPGGVALIVDALTDNRNRTAADVRSSFTKFSGTMGETGSVSFMFDRCGVITYPLDKGSEDEMLEIALDAGAEECITNDDGHEFITTPESFMEVRDALTEKLGDPESAAVVFRPQNTIEVDDHTGETILKLIDSLDELDDVQHVYGNYQFSDTLLEKLAEED